MLSTHPAISNRFLAHVLARQARLTADLEDQLLHSAEQRVARALLVLAGCDGRCPCGCEMPHISQEVIASSLLSAESSTASKSLLAKRL